MKQVRTRNYIYSLGVIVVVFLLALVSALHFATPLVDAGRLQVHDINDGWFWLEGGADPLETAPCQLPATGEVLRLTRSLEGEDIHTDEALLLHTQYTSLRVWADDTLVYEGALGREHALGNMWQFVPMRGFEHAQWVTVELRHYGGEKAWILPEVYLDEADSLRTMLLTQHLPQLLFFGLTVLAAVLLLVGGLYMAVRRLPPSATLLSLALLIFLSGLWILMETKITTIWGGNYAFAYFLGYAALHLVLMPYLFFFDVILREKYRSIKILMWLTGANAVACFLLHLFDVVQLRYTSFTVSLLILAALVCGVRSYWEAVVREKRTDIRWTFLGGLCANAMGVIATALHYLDELHPSGAYHIYGSGALYAASLLVLIVCTIADAISTIGDYVEQRKSMEHYRQLATRDAMTQLRNRNAFQMGMEALPKKEPRQVGIAVFDMDNLKVINDRYGHHVGDQAIYTVSQCLQQHFGDIGYCYRIGGDEFCVVATGEQAAENLDAMMPMVKSCAGACNVDGIPISVSYGHAVWRFQGKHIQHKELMELLDKADQNMYAFKQASKRMMAEAEPDSKAKV